MADFIGQGYLTLCPVKPGLTDGLQLTHLFDLEERHSVEAHVHCCVMPGSPVANDVPAMLAHFMKSAQRIPPSH